MARIVLSNSREIVDNFVDHCQKVGFTKTTILGVNASTNNLYGAVFKKLIVDNQNFVDYGNGDFCSAVGTLFYKGRMGEDALRRIYDDFQIHHDICKIRHDMNGSFALAICRNEMLYAISDATGFYFSYYHIDNNIWVFGTSLYELVKSSCFECSVNEYNLLEECYQHSVLGDETIFNEYKKLTGDNYLEIDLKTNKAQVCHIDNASVFSIDSRPIDIIVKETANEYRKLAKTISSNFASDNIAICMTGGLDSRTTMAALLDEGVKPTMYYGVGNSPLTNTTLGDLEVNKIYSEKFNLPLHIMDWKTPSRIDEAWDASIDKYGMMASMYTSSPAVYDSFDSINEAIVFIGCFGELYRNNVEIEQSNKDYIPIEQIVNQTYLGCDMHSLLGNEYNLYVSNIKNKILKLLAPYIKNESLPKDFFSVISYQIRRNADSIVINYLNQSRYSMSMFAEPSLVKYATIPTSYRDNSRYIIRTLNEIYPPILDVPIYSRHKWQTIDKENMQLAYHSASKVQYYKALFFRNSRLGRWARKTIYPIYVKINERKRFINGQVRQDSFIPLENIAAQLATIFSQLDFFHRKTNPLSSGYVPKESHLAILLTAIKKLGLSFK